MKRDDAMVAKVSATPELIVELAHAFEAEHAAIVESRGPAPIKPKGKGRSRPIIVTDAEGKPKRIATHDRLLEGLLEREGVEAVVEGKPPSVVRCIDCRDPVKVNARSKGQKLPSRCHNCRRERARQITREWNAAHPGAQAAAARARRAVDPDKAKEKSRAQMAAWRAANPEKAREKSRTSMAARRAADPDKAREKNRADMAAWRAANPEKEKAARKARYEREKAAREVTKKASSE